MGSPPPGTSWNGPDGSPAVVVPKCFPSHTHAVIVSCRSRLTAFPLRVRQTVTFSDGQGTLWATTKWLSIRAGYGSSLAFTGYRIWTDGGRLRRSVGLALIKT